MLAPAPGAPQRATLERSDGSEIVYHLERGGAERRQPLLVMLQGSGCDSVTRNDRIPWMAARLARHHAVLTIEKYGVATGADGDQCTAEFWRGNTLTQRALDTAMVVAALRRQPWWDGRLVIFGGSEGGAVAALAAPLIPETRAVIVWSSGIGLPIGRMIRAALPQPALAEADRTFAEARANPTGDRQWGGASYRWWADATRSIAGPQPGPDAGAGTADSRHERPIRAGRQRPRRARSRDRVRQGEFHLSGI